MSLDVYLYNSTPTVKKGTGVFIRENGNTRELTIDEVKERYPESDVQEAEYETDEVYSANITHNLNTMAGEAGIYEHLWRPDEINITKAKELIEPLREGLHKLKSEPEKYKAFNPSNGWGSYEGLVRFVSNYLDACYENPEADVSVSR
jgi:hypothetical protein